MTPVLAAHYILAGGRSRRFGSDKARYVIDGRPMLNRVADAFAPLCRHTFVVAQQADDYADLGLETIADNQPHAGPVEGLRTALRHAAQRQQTAGEPQRDPAWILLSSCDLAKPSTDLVMPLTEARRPDALASVWTTGTVFEPFPGLFSLGVREAPELAEATSFQGLLNALGPLAQTLRVDPMAEQALPWDLDCRPEK